MNKKSGPLKTSLTYLVLLIYFSFFFLPIFWIGLSSIQTSEALFSKQIIPSIGDLTFHNYMKILEHHRFLNYFKNSVITATGSTLLTLVLASLGAYGISKYEIRGKKPFIVGIVTSQMFPFVLILIPFYVLMLTFGMTDTYIGIILSHLILALPFCTWMLKGYFDSIPKELIDSAMIDGCSKLSTLVRIVLPLSAPGLAVSAFYAFVVSWGNYLFVSVLSQSPHTETLPLLLQRIMAGLQVKWGEISAGTVIVVLPVIILFIAVQRWLVEGLLGGAIKG